MRLGWIAAPQFAGVAIVTGIGVALATKSGPEAAALVASCAVAGNVLGHSSATWTLPRLGHRRAAPVLMTLWAVASVLALVLVMPVHPATVWVAAVALAANLCWSKLSVLSRDTVGGWGPLWLRRMGPVGRVGAAIGALAGTFVITAGLPALVLMLCIPAAVVSPAMRTAAANAERRARTWDWGTYLSNLLLALCGYGPLVLQVAFVAATAGAAWAGVSMAVYAAAALAAPRVVRMLPARWTTSAASWLMLAGIADIAWLATLVHPLGGMLAARVLSALALFAAEGSADIAAHEKSASAAALAGRSTGGLIAGSLGTLVLATSGSVVVTACAFAALSVGGIAAVSVARRLAARREAFSGASGTPALDPA